jgi:hypothetical protein
MSFFLSSSKSSSKLGANQSVSQSVSQSRLFDPAIPYTNSGSSLSLHSVKFVHVFASVIHCRFLLRRRVYKIRKSEIRMVWVSSAAPAKSMPLCLCSRQVRNHGLGVLRGAGKEYADCLYSRQVRNQNGLGVHHGTCNRACGLPLLQSFSSQVPVKSSGLGSRPF